MSADKNVAIGRRKGAIARAYIDKGKGNIVVNKKDYKNYFGIVYLQNKLEEPFQVSETEGKYDLKINVAGGGVKGQAEAIQMAIARALIIMEPEARESLKKNRMLRRDARVVERKKAGFRKARKKEQYSKR